MATVVGDLIGMQGIRRGDDGFVPSNGQWWRGFDCFNCSSPQLVAVLRADDGRELLRCPGCGEFVLKAANGQRLPNGGGLGNPKGQPPEDQYIWDEIRACMSVSAWNSAVTLCRKLLFHMAVQQGLEPKNDKGRAPTFAAAVEHLATEGYVTAPMRKWVDKIVDVGNEANHELPAITEDQARMVTKFTQQLLVLAYESPLELELAAGD